MNCNGNLEIHSTLSVQCKFPGADVYEAIQRLKLALEGIAEQIENDYQVLD